MPSHKYYEGRAEAEITKWVEYFCDGMVESFESVKNRAQEAAEAPVRDSSLWLRKLDPRQRKALELFLHNDTITSRDIDALFGISQRMARHLLSSWVQKGFIIIVDPSRKGRRYGLAKKFRKLLSDG